MTYKLRSSTRSARLLLGTASLTALLLGSANANAQDAPPPAEPAAPATQVDEIVVTGFRKSLEDALDAKRRSGNIVDGINAEDIGKSSDQNIAEALQRVTGVSIDRSEGEGSTVTVRGVDANLNNVKLNGVTVTNAAGDVRGGSSGQAVDFSAFSSDILSRIEVQKTASANQDEGSLGATISLTTFKPLEARKNRRIIELQTRYTPFADKEFTGGDVFGGDYRINGAFSQKLFGDTLGISLVATSERNSGRVDAMIIPRFEFANAAQPFVNGAGQTLLPGGLTNADTGNLDQNPTNSAGQPIAGQQIRVMLPFELAYDQNRYETDRNNITGSIQWRPTDRTDIQIDGTYTRVDRKRDRSQFAIRPSTEFFPLYQGTQNVYDPSSSTLLSYRSTANNVGPGNARNPGYIRPVREIEDVTEETFVIGFDARQELGDFKLKLSGGHSDSRARDNEYIYATAQIENQDLAGAGSYDNGFNGYDNRPGLTKGFDCVRGGACWIFLSDTVPNRTQGGTNGANPNLAIVDDGFEFDIGSINSRDRSIHDKSTSVFFDVEWDRSFGPITSIEVGAKWDRRSRVQRQTNSFLDRFAFSTSSRQNIQPWVVAGESALDDNFGVALGLPRDSITDGIVKFDPLALRAAIQQINPAAGITSPDLRDFRDLENTVYGGYMLANFALFDGRIKGDIGGRYVHTDVNVSGGALASPSLLGFTTRPENLAYFGYYGAGNPSNTRTLEQAQTQVQAILGRDLIAVGMPGYVSPTGVPVSDTFSYDNFLPSLNVNWLANKDVVVRFAASRTMARPNIDRIRPNFLFNEDIFSTSFATGGNPRLKPFTSTNLDLSVEWYFARNSLVSVALFNKNIKDAERSFSQTFYIRDFRNLLFDANGAAITDPAQYGSAVGQPGFVPSQSSLLLPYTPDNQPLGECLPNRVLDLSLINGARQCEPVQFNQPINAASAYVRGVEFSVQHAFTWLPGFFSGFGLTANYTYSDSEVAEQTIQNALGQSVTFAAAPLPNTSKHTLNTTLYYERKGVQLRLAYNTRSDFLRSSAPEQGGTRTYGEGYSSLDLSGGVDITKSLRFNFQAVNLLNDVRRDYAVLEQDQAVANAIPGEPLSLGQQPTHRTTYLSNSGTIYRVGLRLQF